MNNSKIGTFESIMLVLSVVIIHTVLSLPKVLIDTTKSATFINLIYVSVLAFILVYIICKLLKNFPNMDLIDISNFLGGKIFKNIIGTIFIIYFVLSSSIFLRNFCEHLRVIYYPSTNVIFLISFFIISVCVSNSLEFNSAIKANALITPFALISIILLFFANIRYFSGQRIFPILGDGFFNTFVYGLGNIYAFNGIVFLYFLPPLLKKPEKFKKVAYISIAISACYIILAVSIILFMFPFFLKINEIIPLYTAATFIEFGTFFQRLESIFLLIWIVAFSCYLSIVCRFSMHFFKKITNIKNTRGIALPFSILFLGVSLVPNSYSIGKFYEFNFYRYFMIAVVFIISIGILILASIKKRKKVGDNKYD